MNLDSSSINSGKCESCYCTEMKMDYTSNTLLLAVLLFASAVAVNSQDSLCKSMVETNGYVCEEHKVSFYEFPWGGLIRRQIGHRFCNNMGFSWSD